MKQDFLVLIGMQWWQPFATVLFFIIYFANVWFALRQPKHVLTRCQELPFHEK